nr:DNA damage-inducible protein 1-like [Tanacetum cinerariifolium]
MESLDVNSENKEMKRLHLFQFSLRDQASNWIERLPVGSILTWEDLTTCFLAWFFHRDFAKPVKEISLPQDVLSTSDHRLIELENQVQRLMEAHLVPRPYVQVNKIASSCEICGGSHDTRYCMENPKQTFVCCSSSRTDEAGDQPQIKALTVNGIETPKSNEPKKALEDEFKDLHLNLPVLEVLAHAPMYNTILDKYAESLELGKNRDSNSFDTLADLGSCVNLIPLYRFKTLKIGLLEETENVLGLAAITDSCLIGIMRNIKVYVGKLKLLEYFYVIDMEKSLTCPLLVGRGFLATSSVVIDCKKSKIAVGEGITRSIFRVREVGYGHENKPYWTTIARRKSYDP